MNYYNEFDRHAAAWLRELIKAKLIPNGHVDERSITEVRADDLVGFTQCHFFAGIGGWPLALKLAGWPEDKPVWTGSCPCQPFSAAGKQMGNKDSRHLWPAFRRLINRARPAIVFGEQVASALGRKWITGVFANLETMGYAATGADLCAAGVGAPHIRQRLYWVANSVHIGRAARCHEESRPEGGNALIEPRGVYGGMADAQRNAGRARGAANEPGSSTAQASARSPIESGRRGVSGGVGNAIKPRLEGYTGNGNDGNEPRRERTESVGSVTETSIARHWDEYDLLACLDGKTRRIEPGSFPLANGVPARVVRLRGYGNAIVPQVAVEFIKAAVEVTSL